MLPRMPKVVYFLAAVLCCSVSLGSFIPDTENASAEDIDKIAVALNLLEKLDEMYGHLARPR